MDSQRTVVLKGGPCDGWQVPWLDSGPAAQFFADDGSVQRYYLTEGGDEAIWHVDALRAHLDQEMRGA